MHGPPTNMIQLHQQPSSDNKITEEDFGTTTLASSSRNEIYSNATMSWRNKQQHQQL